MWKKPGAGKYRPRASMSVTPKDAQHQATGLFGARWLSAQTNGRLLAHRTGLRPLQSAQDTMRRDTGRMHAMHAEWHRVQDDRPHHGTRDVAWAYGDAGE